MVNEVTPSTRKGKMPVASETAATGLGMGEAGPHKQPRIIQTDRRESWIPYPTLDSGETGGTMDYTEFTRRCQEDVDSLFDMVNEAYESFEAANRTITALRSQITDLEDENQRFKDEVSRREEQTDDLIDERDRLQRTVVHLAAAQVESTPSRGTSATPAEKSVKLPNPPILTDGKDPEFEDWESRMRNKLKANSDHYDTEALRIAYVENRVGGKAAKHLRPRLRVDTVNPYTTAEEMLKHLETIFRDPNKEANAKRDFRKLNMRATDNFQDFLTSFLHLAGEAKIPDTMYKDELYQRITWKLQEMTVKESMDSEIDFDAYTAVCTKLADHLSVINESRRLGSKSNISTSRTAENTEAPMSRTEARKREGTPSGTAFRTADILPPEKRELFRSGKCYYCRLSGHIAKDCPRKRKDGTLKEIEPKEESEEEPLNFQP
jgi:FtsZ-binding cell division protein ZapB